MKAQTLSWVQSTSIAGINEINPSASAIDLDKNVYTTGLFTGSIDIDPSAGITTLISTSGVTDIYLQKLDSSGNFIWGFSLTGNSYNSVSGVKTDASGNVYLVGSFSSPVDFDPGVGTNIITPNGDRDAFIVKFNANGIPQWVHHFGTLLFNAAAQTLAIDNSNNILLSGYFQDTVDFDPGAGIANLVSSGWASQFILKINSSGALVFAKSIGGTDYLDSKGISIDALNNISITGTFYGTCDFNPGAAAYPLSSNSSDDIFLVQLNSTGNFNWAYSLGNAGYENVAGIANDMIGNIYLAGSFSDSIDMNPDVGVEMHYANGNSDMMILKLNSLGQFIWGKNLGGQYNEQINTLFTDQFNNVYLCGQFEDMVDFDPATSIHQLTSNGLSDIFISSLDVNGHYRMAKNIGGASDDKGISLVMDQNNHLFCTGLFKDTVDFDPTIGITQKIALSAFNPGDAFTFKWDLCNTSSSSISAYDCNSVLFNGNTYTSSGNFTEVLNASNGCDSLVNLSISIGNNNTILNHVQCMGGPFVFNGITYSAPGTYVQNYLNQAGCDSNFTIHLSYGAPSSYFIQDTACDVYFFGSQILFTSGNYAYTIPNASGCDSTISLSLFVKYSSYNSISVTSCGPYNFNGTMLGFSGLYSGIFPAANGCDSSVDLDLNVVITSSSSQTATACKTYLYNGNTYTTSGVYLDTFTNVFGCDSVVTLNLTITSPNISLTQSGLSLSVPITPLASYQWINCSTGNSIIPGATGSSFTPTANGDYAVIVSVSGCTDTSLCKTVNGVATTDLDDDNTILMYPNPVHKNLSINAQTELNDLEIIIFNMLGQEMYRNNFPKMKQVNISTSSWAAGSYIVTMKQGNRQWIQKLLKQ